MARQFYDLDEWIGEKLPEGALANPYTRKGELYGYPKGWSWVTSTDFALQGYTRTVDTVDNPEDYERDDVFYHGIDSEDQPRFEMAVSNVLICDPNDQIVGVFGTAATLNSNARPFMYHCDTGFHHPELRRDELVHEGYGEVSHTGPYDETWYRCVKEPKWTIKDAAKAFKDGGGIEAVQKYTEDIKHGMYADSLHVAFAVGAMKEATGKTMHQMAQARIDEEENYAMEIARERENERKDQTADLYNAINEQTGVSVDDVKRVVFRDEGIVSIKPTQENRYAHGTAHKVTFALACDQMDGKPSAKSANPYLATRRAGNGLSHSIYINEPCYRNLMKFANKDGLEDSSWTGVVDTPVLDEPFYFNEKQGSYWYSENNPTYAETHGLSLRNGADFKLENSKRSNGSYPLLVDAAADSGLLSKPEQPFNEAKHDKFVRTSVAIAKSQQGKRKDVDAITPKQKENDGHGDLGGE